MDDVKNLSAAEYIKVINKDFAKYKSLGDRTFDQLNEEDFHYTSDYDSNSIAILIQHMAGNLKSRFTDFYSSDGEKPDRKRDNEFIEQKFSKEKLLKIWEEGWKYLFNVLDDLKEDDLMKIVYVRGEPHSIIEALNRQLSHDAYHVGQIVLLAKQIKKSGWKTLSIPKGKSEQFNKDRNFSK